MERSAPQDTLLSKGDRRVDGSQIGHRLRWSRPRTNYFRVALAKPGRAGTGARAPSPAFRVTRRASSTNIIWQRFPRSLFCFLVESILATALGQDPSPSALEEKRDLLQRLLARLAHEIRNPLSSLDVHVQLLDEDLTALAPTTREQLTPRLQIIRGGGGGGGSIVSQFLRLTGPSALDLEQADISKLVLHVCNLLRPEAGARGIELLASLPETLPELPVDSVRLTQALMNLVINAIQAVEKNGRIDVSAAVSAEILSVFVRDNGPGIPADKVTALFDPFFTTKAEGHGLGLWIAQQIVTAHGGRLTAQNNDGGGATFTIAIPLRKLSDAE